MKERDLVRSARMLIEGAKANDLRLMTAAVANGAEVNLHGGEALHAAAWRGREEAVRWLVEHGADVTYNDSVAARTAAERTLRPIVEFLVTNGASREALVILDLVEQGHSLGSVRSRVALRTTAKVGCLDVLRVVLKYSRAPFTIDDLAGALADAIRAKQSDAVQVLIQAADNTENDQYDKRAPEIWQYMKRNRLLPSADLEEYKNVVVGALLEARCDVHKAALRVGVTPRTLRQWRKRYAPEAPDFLRVPDSPEVALLHAELQRERKRREVMTKAMERLC